jgi:hypothetical protein
MAVLLMTQQARPAIRANTLRPLPALKIYAVSGRGCVDLFGSGAVEPFLSLTKPQAHTPVVLLVKPHLFSGSTLAT